MDYVAEILNEKRGKARKNAEKRGKAQIDTKYVPDREKEPGDTRVEEQLQSQKN